MVVIAAHNSSQPSSRDRAKPSTKIVASVMLVTIGREAARSVRVNER